MRISIVTTMYRSAGFLDEFYRRCVESARRLGVTVEVVFVNDGSPDDSLAVALALREAHGNVRVVDLSRNFGHHPAIMAGLAHAEGERVFLIDCDLEEAPELLEQFWAEMETSGSDVVYGQQANRLDKASSRLLAWAYYRVHTWMCDEHIPENLMTVRLMSRRYVDSLLTHREVDFVVSALWARTGFKQSGLVVAKGKKAGTTYTMRRKLALLFRMATAVSVKPLYAVGAACLAVFAFSALVAAGAIIARIATGVLSTEGTMILASVWLLGGLCLLTQAAVAVYLGRVYVEAKGRPSSIVREVHEPTIGAGHEQLSRAG